MRVLIQFEQHPLLFENPERIISCHRSTEIPACFEAMENALSRGKYLAGLLSYEAGLYFEEKLRATAVSDFPLVAMGVYHTPERAVIPPKHQMFDGAITDIRFNIDRQAYAANIAAIRNYIAAGDVYQITYCMKMLFDLTGDPLTLYYQLLREQPVPYPAYIEAEEFSILSLSPELFVKKCGDFVVTKPMKGTWPRGKNIVSDTFARLRFMVDEKNRAENLMITDLLRNDLGRIGRHIAVPRLFEIAGYTTLYQMTSTVTARIGAALPLYDLFAAIFPSGSVTGAPKIRAMQIIRELEPDARRIYTGAIGYVTPGRDLFFNVPIRTLLVRRGAGEMGVGGGIIWDSTAAGEWQETMLKAKFLMRKCLK